MIIKKIFFQTLTIACILLSYNGFAQNKPQKYLDPSFSVDQRVSDLVSRLSLGQKIKLLMYTGTAIDSNGLKIPAYNWWNECLHGVARAGKATVFPQAIGLAATFDAPQIFRVADAISDEARAKYEYFSAKDRRGIYQGLNFWTPNINIFRDPRWGRGMETYGEDPHLTGQIANSFIRGLQGNDPNYLKTIATVKHFAVHSGPESSRHKFNVSVSDRDLYETYTPAFKTAVQDAKVYSLMCAYNSFRGQPCCGSGFLLNDLLRKQWGFNGFIVTDCGAVDDFFRENTHQIVQTPEEASAMAIKAGVDSECGDVFNALDKAVAKKLVTEEELDVALRRLFTARFKLGFFDEAKKVSYKNIPYSVVESPAHVKLSLETTKKSAVLLKNTGNTLPLSKSIKTLAVIGPNANNAEVLLANYHGYPSETITPLQGIRNKLPNTKVLYAPGSALVEGLPVLNLIPSTYLYADEQLSQHGLSAAYYPNTKFLNEPALKRIDSAINFDWIGRPVAGNISEDNFSAIWSGYLKAPVSGKYVLDVYGCNQYELILDDKSLFKFSSEHSGAHRYADVVFEKDKVYRIKIKMSSFGSSPQLRLNWQVPGLNLKADAINIARSADAVVMFMGLSAQLEGEEMKIKLDGFSGGDRTKLKLPDVQENLIKEIAALGKPVILVLINGSAIAINWEQENLPAIIEAWYGGEQAGTAIADILFGDYNPAGRLPVTFYRSEKDIPDFENYNMDGRTYRYFKGKPLYGFGYGLSYTTFSYAKPIAKPESPVNVPITISVKVRNTGARDGDEVVQLYVKNLNTNVSTAIHSLKGFNRIHLKKGEEKSLLFKLQPKDFAIVDQTGKLVAQPGKYEIFVGGGQPFQGPSANQQKTVVKLTGKALPIK